MGFTKVPLYNSDGYGSCQVCGFPTLPSLLSFFDGKWVCPYHRFKHTRAELLENFSRNVRKYRNMVEITGSLSSPPITAVPPEPGGGGSTPPNPGGGGGTTNPPPDPDPIGGTPPGFTEGNICID